MAVEQQPEPTSAEMRMLFYGLFIHSSSLTELEYETKGLIGVGLAGRIEFVERNVEESQLETAIRDHPEYAMAVLHRIGPTQFLFPGLIDTHIHAPQYPNAGLGRDLPLLRWLEEYTYPLENQYKDEERTESVYRRLVQRTLAHGTTCASYFATMHPQATVVLAKICKELGQRAYIGKVCMDRNVPEYMQESPEIALEGQIQVTTAIKNLDPSFSLIRPIITPRFAVSCSPAMLQSLGQYAEKNADLPIQMHLAESVAECTLVRELFPESDSYTDVYARYGLLKPRTILAHCIHISDCELRIIKQHQSGISHCPVSNTGLSSGEAKVREMLQADVDVGLGTDCSGGYTVSVLEAARQASNVSRHRNMHNLGQNLELSDPEILYLATIGGARVLNQTHHLGNFTIGKQFDALLVDLSDENGGNVHCFEDDFLPSRMISKWLYNGDDRNIKKVWVGGRPVK